jgi:hypothetical protein
MDADTVVADLNLVYMSGDNAHAGFPEAAYGNYAEQLVRAWRCVWLGWGRRRWWRAVQRAGCCFSR